MYNIIEPFFFLIINEVLREGNGDVLLGLDNIYFYFFIVNTIAAVFSFSCRLAVVSLLPY